MRVVSPDNKKPLLSKFYTTHSVINFVKGWSLLWVFIPTIHHQMFQNVQFRQRHGHSGTEWGWSKTNDLFDEI